MKRFFFAHILLLACGFLHAAQQSRGLKRHATTSVQSLEVETKAECARPTMRTIGTQTEALRRGRQIINHALDEKLVDAVKAGNSQKVQQLFNPHAIDIPDVNARDTKFLDVEHFVPDRKMDGMTSLMIATDLGDKKIAEFLIKQGADLNLKTNGGLTALSIAIQFGRDKYDEQYPGLEDDQNYSDDEHYPSFEIATMLIKAGADVTINAPHHPILSTALYMACNLQERINEDESLDEYSEKYQELAKDMLRHGAILRGDELDWIPLSDWIPQKYSSDEELAEMLIDAGANINQQDNRGNTPLLREIKVGSTDFIKKILQKGANPYIRNDQGENAFDRVEVMKKFWIDDMENLAFENPEEEKERREFLEEHYENILKILQEFEQTQTPAHRNALQSVAQKAIEATLLEHTGKEFYAEDVAEVVGGYLRSDLPGAKEKMEQEEQEKENKDLNLASMSDE